MKNLASGAEQSGEQRSLYRELIQILGEHSLQERQSILTLDQNDSPIFQYCVAHDDRSRFSCLMDIPSLVSHMGAFESRGESGDAAGRVIVRSEGTEVSNMYDVVLRGGTIVCQGRVSCADVAVCNGRIAALGTVNADRAAEVVECHGLHILPGVIDTHVHFREPGFTRKEDQESGSRSAVMGGVTVTFDMPNTLPQTTTAETLADKVACAERSSFCDFSFFIGATKQNTGQLHDLEMQPGCCGIKVFMGSSTGDMLVDGDSDLVAILRSTMRPIAFHCESEEMLRERIALRVAGDPRSHSIWRNEEVALSSTHRLLSLACSVGRRVHVLHVSTQEEMQLLSRHQDIASVEVTPHHLTLWADDAYGRLGTRAQVNPPLRRRVHEQVLWDSVNAGVVSTIGSDHAPHCRDEKERVYPDTPSGVPGVQTLVPVMLDHVHCGRLMLERFVDLTSAGPARVYGIEGKGRIAEGYDADFTIVDLKRQELIEDSWLVSKCGWSPFSGMKVTGWPVGTYVRGHRVMWQGEVCEKAFGRPVRFVGTKKKENGRPVCKGEN